MLSDLERRVKGLGLMARSYGSVSKATITIPVDGLHLFWVHSLGFRASLPTTKPRDALNPKHP